MQRRLYRGMERGRIRCREGYGGAGKRGERSRPLTVVLNRDYTFLNHLVGRRGWNERLELEPYSRHTVVPLSPKGKGYSTLLAALLKRNYNTVPRGDCNSQYNVELPKRGEYK